MPALPQVLIHAAEFEGVYSYDDADDGKTKLLSYFVQCNVADALKEIGGG